MSSRSSQRLLTFSDLHCGLSPDQTAQELLPVIQFSESAHRIEDFNPKSMKIREIVGKDYNFKKRKFPY
jgi:hypothetical protein